MSSVLSEFALTLATDYPIQAILDHLVERIVGVLPVTAAGVTLISAGVAPHYVAASDDAALQFERLQTDLWQGPCLSAYESGEAVAIPDLRLSTDFPQFAPAAIAAGLMAVFTFPLRHPDGRFGALDLYRDGPGPLNARDLEAAQTLADVAAAYLLNAQVREEARTNTDRFRHIALHDPLTGLPNRLLLQQRLEHAALRARRSHTNAAVLFVDLDRFKQVNDTYGHKVGDELLLAVAHRLGRVVRPGDTLARISGDEFVFVCEDLHSAHDVEILARRVDGAFADPFVLARGMQIKLAASVGMAYAGPGENLSEHLVSEADTAMYEAKRRGGGGHQILDLRETVKSGENSGSWEGDLRSAWGADQLDVAYQPIVRSTDGHVTGVEALLRWTHPRQGRIPSMSIVGVAEQTGLIGGIGSWVLHRSCRDRQNWLRSHPTKPLDLAVNVSARQLMESDFVGTVSKVLDDTQMDASALVLEITENIFLDDGERAVAVLSELKTLGLRLALDDFGTGYSSLSYLRRLPVDNVKIDRTFIADMGHAPRGTAIVAAVTNLAHVLGMSVTAEGVETPDQFRQVAAIGCELAQGFFLARPMPAAGIDTGLGVATGPFTLPPAKSRTKA